MTAQELAAEAATLIASRTGVEHHDIAVILGSGWGGAAELIGTDVASVPAADVPGFTGHAVAGHHATMRSIVTDGGKRVLVLGARQHFYQSRDAARVAHAVRMAAAAGCTTLVVTNGCGSTSTDLPPGSVVAISDHINLTGATPLEGATFVSMNDAYSPRLRALAHSLDADIKDGVYAQFTGPQYETPAEVRMAKVLGADLVGMSTALEVIAAREAGLEVLGLSLVTNLGAGIGGEHLNHQEVLEAGAAAAPRISALLANIIKAI